MVEVWLRCLLLLLVGRCGIAGELFGHVLAIVQCRVCAAVVSVCVVSLVFVSFFCCGLADVVRILCLLGSYIHSTVYQQIFAKY